MKKQIIGASIVMVALAAYTLITSEELATARDTFVKNCAASKGIYAEGVLTKKKWKADDAANEDGKGFYRFEFAKHELQKPTVATLPGMKKELDAPARRLERGKSYSVCMKQDYELIDFYKSF